MALGTITISEPEILGNDRTFESCRALKVTVSWVASADTALIPTLPATDTDQYAGFYPLDARVNPGSTAPTEGYDVKLNDNDGIDIANGQLTNLSASESEAFTFAAVHPIDSNGFSVAISGNAVNSALGTVTLFLARL